MNVVWRPGACLIWLALCALRISSRGFASARSGSRGSQAQADVGSEPGFGAPVAPQLHRRSLSDFDAVSLRYQEDAIKQYGVGPGRDGPWSATWTNSIAVCATMKEEDPEDVVEWIEHYRWLGVDRILLTENSDVQSPHPDLLPYIDSGFVHYTIERTPRAQIMVYGRCIEEHGNDTDWMAFLDIDEFLIVRQPHETLKGLLEDYKLFPGLVVHWVLFGSSHRETRPADGGVMSAYTRCDPTPKQMFKTIANMLYVAGPHNAHTPFFKAFAHPVNEARYPVPHFIGDPGKAQKPYCKDLTEPNWHCPLRPMSELPRETALATVERIALFHYVLKSREDFDRKKKRGAGDQQTPKTEATWETVNLLSDRSEGICEEGSLQADRRLAEAQALRLR